jgi:ADP-heptose:LPS heptosyltransferase
MTPLIQEVENTFPNAKVDLFVKGGLPSILFKNYGNIDRIIQLPKKHFRELPKYIAGWASIKKKKYDIVINVVNNSSSGRLSTQFANARFKAFDNENEVLDAKAPDYHHIAKHPVYNFRYFMKQLSVPISCTPIPSLNLKLSPQEISEGKQKLQQLVGNEKKTISIFTYATGDKRYSESWWEKFYARLKSEYQNFNILEILPVENVSQIAFKALTYYSKDIREIASVIANTVVFIGADSGMMHLANASQTPTVGLFSITDPVIYGPYGNDSLAIDTNTTDMDESVKIIDSIIYSQVS